MPTSIPPPTIKTTFSDDTNIIAVIFKVQIDFIEQRICKVCRVGTTKITFTNRIFDVPFFIIRLVGIMPSGVIAVRAAGRMMPRGVGSVLGALSALS